MIAANNLYHDYENHPPAGRDGGAGGNPHGPAGRGRRGGTASPARPSPGRSTSPVIASPARPTRNRLTERGTAHSEIRGPEARHVTTTNGDIGWIANYIWGNRQRRAARPLPPRQVPRRHPPDDGAAPGSMPCWKTPKQTVLDMKASLDAAGVVAQDQALRKARMGRGFTVMHIYGDELKQLVMPLPPLPEQASIARYIDHAERRITKYIRAKQKLNRPLALIFTRHGQLSGRGSRRCRRSRWRTRDAEIDPVPTSGVGGRAEADLGPALQHHHDVQRSVRRHRVGGQGSRERADSPRPSRLEWRWTAPTRRVQYPPRGRGADEGRGNRGRRHGVRNARVAHCTDRFNNGRPRHRKIVTRCRHCRSPTKTPLR